MIKGLIYENFYLLKKQFFLSGILLILCAILSIMINPYIFFAMSTILVSMLPITACVYENEHNLTKIILTMPINKKDFVQSKYICTLIMGIINFFINLLFMLILTNNLLKCLIFSFISFIISMLLMAYMFPLIFKYGVEKAKGILSISLVVICIILFSFIKVLKLISISNYIIIILLILPLVLFYVSYKISVKNFENLEL